MDSFIRCDRKKKNANSDTLDDPDDHTNKNKTYIISIKTCYRVTLY